MPHQEVSHRRQTAVLWAATGTFDRWGQPVVAAPVEVMVRWNPNRAEALGPDGAPVSLDASVVAGQAIALGSRMWLGKLADFYSTGSAQVDTGVHEVKTEAVTPDVKARPRATHRQYGLVRWRSKQ